MSCRFPSIYQNVRSIEQSDGTFRRGVSKFPSVFDQRPALRGWESSSLGIDEQLSTGVYFPHVLAIRGLPTKVFSAAFLQHGRRVKEG